MTALVNDTELAQLVNQIYDGVKQVIVETDPKNVDINLILSLTMCTMKMVEQLPRISGSQKKQIVIQVITRLVDEIPNIDDKTRTTLHSFIDLSLPATIDAIVYASDGNLMINVKQGCTSIWSSCSSSSTKK